MKRRPAAMIVIALLGAVCLYAQSNTVIDSMLAQPKAAYAETAYMLLVGGGWIPESATASEALQLAKSKGWIAKRTAPEAAIDLKTFSVLAMRALKIPGGVGWTLFHSKLYAYRELVALGVVNPSGGDSRFPSGEEVLRMLGTISSLKEAAK